MEYTEIKEAKELLTRLATYKIEPVAPKAQRALELLEPFFTSAENKERRTSRNIKCSRHAFDPMRELSRAIAALTQPSSLHQEAYDEVGTCNNIQQDLLHAIEFLEHPIDETEEGMSESDYLESLLELATELKEVREIRREGKEFIELVAPLTVFMDKNKKFISELSQVRREMQAAQQRINNRSYTPRALTAVEQAFVNAQEVSGSQGDKQEQKSEVKSIENE